MTQKRAARSNSGGNGGAIFALQTSSKRLPVLEVLAPDERLGLLHRFFLTLVRRDGRDLTARQLSTFLIVYTDEEVQTVTALAQRLNIARPAVSRLMDRLVEFNLVSREEDRSDRRRVLVRRTDPGATFYRGLFAIMGAELADHLDVSNRRVAPSGPGTTH